MLALPDTAAAWTAIAKDKKSRSLLIERFSDPGLRDTGNSTPRKDHFKEINALSACPERVTLWATFLRDELRLANEQIRYAQLQSRLMVNMAGGVMENAGMCLDRFGLPYIPGSAVKGCARRAALAALREWCETSQKPGTAANDQDSLFRPACETFGTPAEMLTAIAQVFGWSEQDWKDKSDFAWACGGHWPQISEQGRSLPRNFAGSVAFLPAYPVDLGKTGKVDGLPVEVPPLGKLELDVVTCHHQDYYSGKQEMATDTEDPIPVVFPAVAAGHVFAFALLPLQNCPPERVKSARAWLATGLSLFGLGAKTAAGYGWFEASDNLHNVIIKSLADEEKRRQQAKQQLREEEQRKAAEHERQRKAAELKAATANMTPEQKADFEIKDWDDSRLKNHFDRFSELTPERQGAIYRLLWDKKVELWQEIRRLALEGKAKERSRWGTFTQAIFQMAKQRKEKMP